MAIVQVRSVEACRSGGRCDIRGSTERCGGDFSPKVMLPTAFAARTFDVNGNPAARERWQRPRTTVVDEGWKLPEWASGRH